MSTTQTLIDVVMPQMGVSVSEGTVTVWRKQVGDAVAADETIVEISTDKVDTEVPSPAAGTVVEILVAEGTTVDVGTAIARIDTGGGPAPAAAPAPAPAPEPTPAAPVPAAASAPVANGAEGDDSMRTFMSPVVARMVAEHGIEIATITGSGRGGRVTKKDIEAHLAGPAAAAPAPAPAAVAAAEAAPAPRAAPAPAPVVAGADEEATPLASIRKVIARNLRASIETNAHVTSIVEIDMTRVGLLRKEINAEWAQTNGVRVSFLPFIMRAVIEAVGHWPWMNAEIRGDQLVQKRSINLGIAVSIDDGKELVVPVIHRAEERNLLGLTRALTDLAERGRAKKLSVDEMSGGTITITNPGVLGTLIGTPIIPPGQSAIVDVCAIVKRPVVVSDEHGNDAIAIRQMMYLPVSYDHRLIDGAYAAHFMARVKKSLETWEPTDYWV